MISRCQCICNLVCTWIVYIPTLLNMTHNSLWFILNTLFLRKRNKIICNNLFSLSGSFLWWMNKNQLEIIGRFIWIVVYIVLCCLLWIWWWGDTISDLFLNLEIEYVLVSYIDGNNKSLGVISNAISVFCSVDKIMPN